MSELDTILQGVPRFQKEAPVEEPAVSVLQQKNTSELDEILSGVPRIEKQDVDTPRLEQGTDPDVLDRLSSWMFKDPEKEGAKAVLAITDATMNDITPSQAMRLRRQIDKGVKINPARAKLRGDVKTIVTQNLQTGFAQVNLGLWGAKVLSGDNSDEAWNAIRQTQAAIPREDERPYPEGMAQEFAGSAAEMFPFLAESAKSGAWRGMILAGGTALLGSATGTQAITYPLMPKMYAIGQTHGSLEFVGKVEAGLAFVDMLDYVDPETGEKINPNVARAAAYGVGAINGLIEFAQLKTLINSIPGGKKLLRGVINETIKDVVKTGALKSLLVGAVGQYGALVAKETTQELAQESTNIVADALARQLTNRLDGTDLSAPEVADIVDRLTETLKTSAQAFAVMGLPGPTMTAAGIIRQSRANKKLAAAQQDRIKKVIRASIIDQARAFKGEQESTFQPTQEEVQQYIDDPESSDITDAQLDAIIEAEDDTALDSLVDRIFAGESVVTAEEEGILDVEGPEAGDDVLDVEGTEAGVDVPAQIGSAKETDFKFVKNSSDSLDFGNIESDPIRLPSKTLSRIEGKKDRLAEIKRMGYSGVEDLVEDVASNYNAIYEGKKRSLIIEKKSGKNELAYVELEKSETGGAYEVKRVIPIARKGYLKNKKLLYRRSPAPAEYPDSLSTVKNQTNLTTLKKQEGYKAAKYKGDALAAQKVIKKLIKKSVVDELKGGLDPSRKTYIVPVLHREGDNLNQLPLAYAEALENEIEGAEVWVDLGKVSGGANTGATAKGRIKNVQRFEGDAPPAGSQVIIVDDNLTTGSTLRYLIDAMPGSIPVAATTLSVSRYGKGFKPTAEKQQALLDKGEVNEVGSKHETGLELQELTAGQIQQYILSGAKGREGLRARFYREGSQGVSQTDARKQEERADLSPGGPTPAPQEFTQDKIKHVGLREATRSGLLSDDEAAVIDGIMQIFPESWLEYFEPRFSAQEFAPTGAQLKAHGIAADQQKNKVVRGALLTEKTGALKEGARHIAVMFNGSNVDTFLHEFGEFAFMRLLGPVQSADMKIVSREYRKARAKFKKRKGNKHKAFKAKNEWFSDGFRDWWLRQLNGESSVVSKDLQGIFRKVLSAVKAVWRRLKAVGKRHPLDDLFNDIITNGRDLQEKYYYSSKETVLRYIIGQDATAEDLKKQGFAENAKTVKSWDPGTICPKKRNLIEYVAKQLSGGDLGDIRSIDAQDAIWDELLDPDYWIRVYDQAVADGIDVPCSYCYVEQTRKVAVHEHNRGQKLANVIAAKAKPVYETTPYRDAILKWKQKTIDDLNARGGLRLFSFSDYVRDWHHDNVKLLLDHAKKRGLSIKAITKNPEFVEDFADRGITINVSIDDGVLGQNGGMPWDTAYDLKKKHKNVKIRTVAMNLQQYADYATLAYKGMRNFVDVITPYHHSDYTKPMPAGASDFAVMLKSDGSLKGKNPESNELIEWIRSHPELNVENRTCCIVGGKCFKPDHQRQCGANCGAFAGNLSVPAQIGDAPKTTIRKTTGQALTKEERLARDDLKNAIRMAARNARIAYRQGKTEGVEEGKAKIRAIVAKSQSAQKTRNSAHKIKEKISKALARTKVKKKDGKPQGRYGAETQEVLDRLRANMRLTQQSAAEQLAANLLKYDDSFPPEAIAMENRLLEMIATPAMGVTEEQIERWVLLLQEIERFKEGGEFEQLRKHVNRMAKMAFVRQEIIDLMGGIPSGIRASGEEAVTDDSLKARIKRGILAGGATNMVQGWKDILDILSFYDRSSEPGESLISTFGDVLDQKNAEKEGNMLAMEELRQMAFDAFGLESDHQMTKKFNQDSVLHNLGTFEDLNGENVTLRMTRAQARKRIMELMDPTLRDTFFTIEGMGWTADMVDAIRNFLTADDEAFIKAQFDWYQKYYNSVDDVYSEIYGVHLPKNPLYSPLSREGVNKDEESGLGEFIKEMPFRASATTAGGLKSRTANVYPVALRNDVEVLMSHVAEMEHFRAWAYKIRDLNAVFSNPKVRQAIRINFGKNIDKTIQNFVQDFARGGSEMATSIRGLDRLRSRYTRGVLAIKPSIFIKQLTSVVAFADSIPVGYFAKELPRALLNMKKATKTLMQSTMMQHRWKSGEIERDIKTMMNSSAYQKMRTSPSIWNMLTVNVKLGDIGAIIWGGYPVYKYHYEKAIDAGMSHTQANDQALRTFESIAETTQQSADLSEQSTWQRSGSFAKLFTMFKSSPNQYLRKEISAIRNRAAGRISNKQFAKTIAIYHFILPMLFQWVSDRFTWDEDEQLRAVVLGSLNGFFILGDGLDFIIRKALDMQTYDLGIPMWQFFEDAGKAIDLADWDNLDADGFLRAIRGLAGATGALTGTPAKQAVDITTGFSDVLSGDYEKGIAEIAGWSPYVAERAAEE